MKIFDYDGYPAVFLHEVSEALQEKDRQIEELRQRIDELEFDLQELVDPL